MPGGSDWTKILAILFVFLLGFVVFLYGSSGQAPPPSSTSSSVRTTTPSSSSVNWANLRGVTTTGLASGPGPLHLLLPA